MTFGFGCDFMMISSTFLNFRLFLLNNHVIVSVGVMGG